MMAGMASTATLSPVFRPTSQSCIWSAALSKRERQIALCVAGGCTNRDIARTLEITEKTVEKHLTRVFHKLAIRSRSQLAIFIVTQEPL